jgi:nucleotide-binding universal stress UspA family protein
MTVNNADQERCFMENFKRILVISRMDPYNRKVVHVGVSLARKNKAELLILHLVTDPVRVMAVNVPGLFPVVEYPDGRDGEQEAKEQLDKIIKEEIDSGFPIKELIRDNTTIDEIVKVIRDEKINLIIMSAHEEGRIEHALFGGENDAIIRKMPCSILLVKNSLEGVDW